MKGKSKLFFALLLALSLPLVFGACSKDDNENNSIVGTWKFNRAEASVKTNSSENDAIIGEYILKMIGSGQRSLTFNADNSFKATYYDDDLGKTVTDVGTYEYVNGVLTLKYSNNNHIDVHKTLVQDNTLTIVKDEYSKQSDLVEDAGITDPNFKVTTAIGRIIFDRQ